jgi:hypothetical protein
MLCFKVPVIAESLKKAILKEHKAASEATYGVSTVLSSAGATCRSRSEGLLSLLNEESSYNILKFEMGCVSCFYARRLFFMFGARTINICLGHLCKSLQGPVSICDSGDIYISAHVSS